MLSVLEKLCRNSLYAKWEKCKFDWDTFEFLRYIILPMGVALDSCKVLAIMEWALPKDV